MWCSGNHVEVGTVFVLCGRAITKDMKVLDIRLMICKHFQNGVQMSPHGWWVMPSARGDSAEGYDGQVLQIQDSSVEDHLLV